MTGLFCVGRAAAERQHRHFGGQLAAIVADDMEEMKHQPGAVMGRDKRAAALLADQNVLADQFVDRLAHRADRDLESLGEFPFGGNGATGLPLAGTDGFGQQPLDFLVERCAQRGAGNELLVSRGVFPFAHAGISSGVVQCLS